MVGGHGTIVHAIAQVFNRVEEKQTQHHRDNKIKSNQNQFKI